MSRPTEEETSFYLNTKDIEVSKDRGRKAFSEIDSLMNSIRSVGLIHPIVVTEKGEDREGYVLVAGERRLRAMLLLGMTEIRCTLRENLSPQEQKAIEIEENLRRVDLSWEEEIFLLAQLNDFKIETEGETIRGDAEDKGWNQQKTAELVGMSVSGVSERIKLARLLEEREDIKEKVRKLPLYVAMKTAKQMLENEKLDRLQASGMLKVDSGVRLGKAEELIKELKAESVGLILTDPPFGIPQLTGDEKAKGRYDYSKGKSGTSTLGYTSRLIESDNATEEEVIWLFNRLVDEFDRVLMPGGHGYVFFAFECYAGLVGVLSQRFLVDPVPLIWYKGRVTSPFSGYSYQPCYEPILFFLKEPKTRRLVKPGKKVLEFAIVPSKEKEHPFEKPRELLRFLIGRSTREGEVVLDPFAGSGSTILAARETGRTGLGFEVDEEHWKDSQRLLKED